MPHLALNRSRWRLVRIITTVAATGLVVMGVLSAITNERIYQTEKTKEIITKRHILARLAVDMLELKDHALAQRDIKAMDVDPGTEAIAIYDAHNLLFAGYSHSVEQRLPPVPPPDGTSHDGNRLTVSLPVLAAQAFGLADAVTR